MNNGKIGRFLNFLYDMHLYDTNGEGLFKAALITFSWFGGVYIKNLPSVMTTPVATSLFLFAIALIMEYTVKLVTTEKIATRILPFIVFIVSIVCAIITFAQLAERPIGINLRCIYDSVAFMQIIIWVDVSVRLFVGKPNSVKTPVEAKLKNVEVN